MGGNPTTKDHVGQAFGDDNSSARDVVGVTQLHTFAWERMKPAVYKLYLNRLGLENSCSQVGKKINPFSSTMERKLRNQPHSLDKVIV